MISCSRSSSSFCRTMTDSMMARSSGVKWDKSGPSSMLALVGHHPGCPAYPSMERPARVALPVITSLEWVYHLPVIWSDKIYFRIKHRIFLRA